MSKKKKRRDLISFTGLTGTDPEELKTSVKEQEVNVDKEIETIIEEEKLKEVTAVKETEEKTGVKKEEVSEEHIDEPKEDDKKEQEENQNNVERGAEMSLETVIETTYSNIVGEKKKKVLRGIYFDSDVAQALDKIGKQGGRGAKSEYVNSLIRAIMVKQGLLKE